MGNEPLEASQNMTVSVIREKKGVPGMGFVIHSFKKTVFTVFL